MNDIEHALVDEKIAELETKLRRQYDIAYKEMQAKQKTFMADYEKERVKMERKYQNKEITYKEYRGWLRDQAIKGEWFKGMVNSLAADMNNVNKMAAGIINDELPEVYASNMNYGTYLVESGAMVSTGWSMADRDTVAKLVKDNPKLLPDAKVNSKKDVRWNKQKFNSAILQSVLQGESIKKTSKRLRDVIGMNYNSSVRSARTAMTAAENMGRMRSFERAEDIGINLMKQWMATLDKRTRDTHRELDGETIPVKETFWNGLMYPGDPDGDPSEVMNCRCTLVTVIEDYDYSNFSRRSNYGSMSYEEWKYEHYDQAE